MVSGSGEGGSSRPLVVGSEPLVLESRGEEETRRLGERLAAGLRAGDRVAVSGPLGAGKTVLVRGMCEALGVPDEMVTSPSFAIVNTYRGRHPVFHVDLYRVADIDEVEATGLLDLADTGVVLIEWIDRVPELMEETTIRVDIDDLGADVRRLTFRRPRKGGRG